MSNFDHRIEPEFAEQLARPKTFGSYAGWNFWGWVWKEDDRFYVQVEQLGRLAAIRTAPSLPELMKVVSEEFGWD